MKLETERDFNEWLAGTRALAVVSAWSRLGLWDRLRAGPVARADLPVDARALAVTVPVLAHVGLVVGDGDRIGLTASAERLLATGGMPSERNLETLGDLARTADVLRDGGPVRDANGRSKATSGGTLPDDPVATERFLDMLYRMSDGPSQETLTWLGTALPPKGSVLDLGGGHGRYARAFADAGHEVTLFDQPMVIELARKRHGDVLRYLDGDFHTVDSFGGPYDLVLLCNIVHGESDAANASIVARVAKSLKAGGRIAVRDMFLDEQEQNPSSAVFFGMVMLFYTEGGMSPTMRRAHEWFGRAGLTDVRTMTFDTHQILTARKNR